MKTESENRESEMPQVGSKEVAEERQKSMKMRQYASSALREQKDPNAIIKELVSMGMEEQKATELVDSLLKGSSSVIQETQNEPEKWGRNTNIPIGIGLIFSGLAFTWISYSMAESGMSDSIIITYGLVGVGICLLLKGILTKKKAK